MHSLLQSFYDIFSFSRAATIELIRGLPPELLDHSPSSGAGTLARQFRHMGLVQYAYRMGIVNGKVDFALRPASRIGLTAGEIVGFLQSEDHELLQLLNGIPEPEKRFVDWYGTSMDLLGHLMCLAQHETLHQGQWAAFSLAGKFQLSPSLLNSWFVDLKVSKTE